jgi:DNA helicase-2/ATP-dependent DNA helicase PcrA
MRTVQPGDVASEIEWAKARMLTPDEYGREVVRVGRKPPLGVDPMVELYRRYESEKTRRGVVDFDDLLWLCVQAIDGDKAFAARQRWRFRHLFVDEFQDVNPVQHRLLEGWRGSSADLCVVGDPNQAIYAWNGADPRYIIEFAQHHPGAQVLRLEDNYRSSPEILMAADAVLGLGSRVSRPLRPNRPSADVPTVSAFPSDIEEARAIARAMRERHSPQVPWHHMAVLMRTNAQALVFEEAFRAAGIPFVVRGEGTFLSQPEIRTALADLRRGPASVPLASRLSDLEDLVTEASTKGGTGAEGVNERQGRLEGLVRLAQEFVAANPSGTVPDFSAWLQGTITGRADEPERGGGTCVEITTFHRAKGLEWPIVFLAGLERGYVPIGQANSEDQWDEERRLLYVAVTRAERELHCSWAQQRTFGARTTGRNPSPWLANIEAAAASCRATVNPGDWRTTLRAQRERLEAAKRAGVPGIRGTRGEKVQVGTNADPKLLEALKAWRKRAAQATGVPAFVICHDTTLAAVAEARPRTHVALLALPGMGPVKVDRFGDQLLAVVAQAS